MPLVLAITTICAAVLLALVVVKRIRLRREMEQHSITPEALSPMEIRMGARLPDLQRFMRIARSRAHSC
jgi:hypothetical protein